MKIQQETGTLQPMAAACEGEIMATSVHAPQTNVTGDEVSKAPDAGAQVTTERERDFRALMEGEYKDLFTAYFQETFNRRFKEHKEIKAELERTRAVVQAAAQYFHTSDRDELLAALRVDKNEKTLPQEGGDLSPGTSVCEDGCVQGGIPQRLPRPTESALGIGYDRVPGAGKMTREERAELARRAARGEYVTL